MSEFDDFELPEAALEQAEANVASLRRDEENQAPIEAGEGCEGGACVI